MISHRLVRHRSSDLRMPGSTREFPDNRENNREFCEFAAIQAIPNVNSRSNSNVLYVNSLSVRNREIFRANREFIRPNRESSPPIGFMETVCQPSENAFRSMTREWRRVNPQATGVKEPVYRSPTSANHSSSVSTLTPASRALSSFEPAPGPATT